MENRFAIKDFFLFLVTGVLIVLVLLAMFQFDRQFTQVKANLAETRTLAEDVNRLKVQLNGLDDTVLEMSDQLAAGVTVNSSAIDPTATSRPVVPGALIKGEGRTGSSDPFYLVEEAAEQTEFARGGWFIDNFGTKIGRLTPFVSSDVYQTWIQNQTMESLAYVDPYTLEWMPRLARGWTISDDGLEMTFKLRRNINFSDGTPITADDVVFTYDWIRNPEVRADRTRSYLGALEKVEKIDDETVRFTFNKPYFQNFAYAAGSDVPILPKHFYENFTPTEFNEAVGLLMGSGPYMLERTPRLDAEGNLDDSTSWTPGDGVTLIRNPRYWGTPATFDRIVFTEIESEDTEAVRLRNQEQDLFRATPELYTEMTSDPQLMSYLQDQKHDSPFKGYTYTAWNQVRHMDGQTPEATKFADKRVRRAMTMLLDRAQMNKEIFGGLYDIASGPFYPRGPQHNPDVEPWPYDPERALELLEEAGWQDRDGDGVLENSRGEPFEFTLTYPGGSPVYEKIVLFMRDNFKRGKINMKAERLDWPVLVSRLTAKDFDAIILGWSGTPESDPYQIFHSSQIEGEGDNRISYRSEALDNTIEEARRTMEVDERMKLWQEIHAILHEDQPYTFMFFRPNLYLFNKRIKNIEQSQVGLNFEYLNGGMMPWYIPTGQQSMQR